MQAEHDNRRPKPATHVGAYMLNENVSYLALCDVDISKQRGIPYMKKGVVLFSSITDMFNWQTYDIVSIATPKSFHLENIMCAVDGGARVIVCEKPIAENLEEAIKVVDYCNSKGCVLIVNHVRRFLDHFVELKEKIRSGYIGDIQKINCVYSGGIYETGTHLIDILRFLFGEIELVTSVEIDYGDDPRIDANLFFDNGPSCFIQSINEKFYNRFAIDIYGTSGMYRIDDMGFCISHGESIGSRMFSNSKEIKFNEREDFFTTSWEKLACHAIECLEGKPSVSSGYDACEVLKVIDALEESFLSGCTKYVKRRFG